MPKRKRVEPEGTVQHWIAYEVATGFETSALVNKEKVVEMIGGMTPDELPALEKAKILVPAGKNRKARSRRLYILRQVVALRNNPDALDDAMDAILAATKEKNDKQKQNRKQAA